MITNPIPDVSKLDRPQDLWDNDYGVDSFPSHIITLYENWTEIIKLVDIQDKISDQKKFGVLNKAGIVLLVASWEAFIEDLAQNAFEHLIEHAQYPEIFSNKVLALASKEIFDDKNKTKVWGLAGNGWKNILKNHKAIVIDRYIGRLNTPRPEQIDSLFFELIGYKKISSKWKWRGMPINNSIKKLESLIDLRGEIAHRATSSKKVLKKDIVNYAKFISRISVISSNRLSAYVYSRTEKPAWKLLRIGETYR